MMPAFCTYLHFLISSPYALWASLDIVPEYVHSVVVIAMQGGEKQVYVPGMFCFSLGILPYL